MTTEAPSIHPTRRLHAPAGEPVEIDLDMVPLIRSLWALDLTTLGCCQDTGEYARARREMFPRGEPTGHSGFIDYHLGWAWLKMPIADTTRLTKILLATSFRDAVTIRWQRGSWRLDIPFIYDVTSGMGPATAVQIHFPREQIPELSATLNDLMVSVQNWALTGIAPRVRTRPDSVGGRGVWTGETREGRRGRGEGVGAADS